MTTIKTVKQMDELVNLGDGAAWHEKWRVKLTTLFHQVTNRLFVFHLQQQLHNHMANKHNNVCCYCREDNITTQIHLCSPWSEFIYCVWRHYVYFSVLVKRKIFSQASAVCNFSLCSPGVE